MPALVAGNGNAVCIFLNSTFHNFVYAAVMAQVNDLGPLALQNTTHNINGGIVPVKQGGGSNNPYFIHVLNNLVKLQI